VDCTQPQNLGIRRSANALGHGVLINRKDRFHRRA
jgi:hypothetical protein